MASYRWSIVSHITIRRKSLCFAGIKVYRLEAILHGAQNSMNSMNARFRSLNCPAWVMYRLRGDLRMALEAGYVESVET